MPETLRGAIIDISNYTRSFVRKIVCGNNHCLILFNDGQLACFGSNEEGQLGFSFSKENYLKEITVNKFSIDDPISKKQISDFEIWDIAAGDNFSLILVRSGMRTFVVRFGISPQDKYASDMNKIKTINLVQLDYDKIGSLSKIYVFGQRSILLTMNNVLYVGGMDFELNTLDIDKYVHLERFNKQVMSVNIGLEHCLVLDCKLKNIIWFLSI